LAGRHSLPRLNRHNFHLWENKTMKNYLRPFFKTKRTYRVWFIGEKAKTIKSDSTYNAVRKFAPKEFTYISYCNRLDSLSFYVVRSPKQTKSVHIYEIV
jgi:hypothetical protein